MAIKCNQMQSNAINSNQWQSIAIKGTHLRELELNHLHLRERRILLKELLVESAHLHAIRRTQAQSNTIKLLVESAHLHAIRVHQAHSSTIKRTQAHSSTLKRTQAHSSTLKRPSGATRVIRSHLSRNQSHQAPSQSQSESSGPISVALRGHRRTPSLSVYPHAK